MPATVFFAYEADATNADIQSGRPFSLRAAFLRAGYEVVDCSPLPSINNKNYVHKILSAQIFGRKYRPERHPHALKLYAEGIMKVISQHMPNPADRKDAFVFSPGSVCISALPLTLEMPVFFCADATFASMTNYYPEFSKLSKGYVKEANQQERMALARADAAIYPSRWAAESAIRDHGGDPEKVLVIPFGSNMRADRIVDINRRLEDIRQVCRFAMIGRDWHRKGGPMSVRIWQALRERGVPSELHVAGPVSRPGDLPAEAHYYGALDRRIPEQAARLQDILEAAHFLTGFSEAEAFGLQFADAAFFGLPSVCFDTGGISAAVEHGKTGFCFRAGTSPEEIAAEVAALIQEPDAYARMVTQSRERYETVLNWDVFVRSAGVQAKWRVP